MISGYVSLPNKDGKQHLVGTYIKVKPPLTAYESGLCVWNEEKERFERHRVLWTKTAEADRPTGPWGPAVKIVSHANYTFYNPRLHPEFTPADSPILLFEGTYTRQFAKNPAATPRHESCPFAP